MFNMIEPSPHDAATAYVTATRYKNDDYAPYVFKTTDYGESWTLITAGIADDHFCRAIREDPNREGLLYLGTEFGLYISFNGGSTPGSASNSTCPSARFTTMKVKGTDLVIATHGRSFWILDDLTVLHQYNGRHRRQSRASLGAATVWSVTCPRSSKASSKAARASSI